MTDDSQHSSRTSATLTLPDGRRLRVHEGGDPDGELVVVHHGSPSCGALEPGWSEDARRRGIRLVGYDRPGYGGSDAHPGRTVADAAADTAAIADHLGTDRFRTWGISGGGPHVLGCAALLPDRVLAAACLAGVAPSEATGLDWGAGMGQDNLDEFAAARRGGTDLAPYLEQQRARLMAATAEVLREVMGSLLSPVDLSALDAYGDYLHQNMTAALEPGIDGWLDDDLAFVHDWGFSPSDITVPVLVLAGEADLAVPVAHGRWLSVTVPAAEERILPDDGHLSMWGRVGQVHEWLLARPGPR